MVDDLVVGPASRSRGVELAPSLDGHTAGREVEIGCDSSPLSSRRTGYAWGGSTMARILIKAAAGL